MHLENDEVPAAYLQYTRTKLVILIAGVILLFFLFILSISSGAVSIPPLEVFQTLIGESVSPKWTKIILSIRLPQALTAIVAGAGLGCAGLAMQSILRNPLASPFTFGIAHAAAFGAAFSIIILGSGVMQNSSINPYVIDNPFTTTFVAFLSCLLATGVILFISHLKRATPEVTVLAGVAIGSLCTAATMFLQLFADDTQLAAVVFWTFGDVSRADWGELSIMAIVTGLSLIYFYYHRWDYNAIDAGDETASSLGVHVSRIRIVGMIVVSVITAVIMSFLGIIGFVGLISPHIIRTIIGDDHRFTIPGTIIMGAILLLASDTVGRVILIPHVVPVAVVTSFLGAPMFLYLLIRGYNR